MRIMIAILRAFWGRSPQNLGGVPGVIDRNQASRAFAEIKRITDERLHQAVRIQQALDREALAEEIQAERQKYLTALHDWNATLEPYLAVLTDTEPWATLFCDDLFGQDRTAIDATIDGLRFSRRWRLEPEPFEPWPEESGA